MNFCYLLGVIYADGSLRNIWLTLKRECRFRWEITITDESYNNLTIIAGLLEDVFGIKTRVKQVYSGKWYRLLFYSMILFRLLNNLFDMPMGYKKGKLRIPKLIFESNDEIRKYFLIGFFDGDGHCAKANVGKKCTPIVAASQSSRAVLEDLSKILNSKGLNFSIHTKTRDKYKWFSLETKSMKQIVLFQKEFGFIYPKKKKRLRNLVASFNFKEATS